VIPSSTNPPSSHAPLLILSPSPHPHNPTTQISDLQAHIEDWKKTELRLKLKVASLKNDTAFEWYRLKAAKPALLAKKKFNHTVDPADVVTIGVQGPGPNVAPAVGEADAADAAKAAAVQGSRPQAAIASEEGAASLPATKAISASSASKASAVLLLDTRAKGSHSLGGAAAADAEACKTACLTGKVTDGTPLPGPCYATHFVGGACYFEGLAPGGDANVDAEAAHGHACAALTLAAEKGVVSWVLPAKYAAAAAACGKGKAATPLAGLDGTLPAGTSSFAQKAAEAAAPGPSAQPLAESSSAAAGAPAAAPSSKAAPAAKKQPSLRRRLLQAGAAPASTPPTVIEQMMKTAAVVTSPDPKAAAAAWVADDEAAAEAEEAEDDGEWDEEEEVAEDEEEEVAEDEEEEVAEDEEEEVAEDEEEEEAAEDEEEEAGEELAEDEAWVEEEEEEEGGPAAEAAEAGEEGEEEWADAEEGEEAAEEGEEAAEEGEEATEEGEEATEEEWAAEEDADQSAEYADAVVEGEGAEAAEVAQAAADDDSATAAPAATAADAAVKPTMRRFARRLAQTGGILPDPHGGPAHGLNNVANAGAELTINGTANSLAAAVEAIRTVALTTSHGVHALVDLPLDAGGALGGGVGDGVRAMGVGVRSRMYATREGHAASPQTADRYESAATAEKVAGLRASNQVAAGGLLAPADYAAMGSGARVGQSVSMPATGGTEMGTQAVSAGSSGPLVAAEGGGGSAPAAAPAAAAPKPTPSPEAVAAAKAAGPQPRILALGAASALPSTDASIYLGTVANVASADECAALCSAHAAGADNTLGRSVRVSPFAGTALGEVAGYMAVSPGTLATDCVAASYYSAAKSNAGGAATAADAARVGHVCDLWAGLPAGNPAVAGGQASLLEFHPEPEGSDDSMAMVLVDRWDALTAATAP
jgi:chemotaxis protein histidine kinase CheA